MTALTILLTQDLGLKANGGNVNIGQQSFDEVE